MLTPEYLTEITDASEELAAEIHTEVLRRIIRRMLIRLLKSGKLQTSATDSWNLATAVEAGALKEDLTRYLSKVFGKQKDVLKDSFDKAILESVKFTDEIFKKAGIPTTSVYKSPYMVRLMQRNYEKTVGTMQNFTGTYADVAQQTFIRECDKAYNLATSGVVSPTQAIYEAVETVAEKGVFVDYTQANGRVHRDTIETATTRAVRTGIGQMTGDIEMTRMEEMDWDIILVSAHLGARYGDGGENPSNHYWWQGKFYSRTGRTKEFPPFSVTGYGTGEGLCGWNCRHSFGAGDGVFNPYTKYDAEENKRIYDLTQKQRARERAIRQQKRIIMTHREILKTIPETSLDYPERKAKLDNSLDKLEKMNKKYLDFCKENNLRPLDDRLHVGGYNKKTIAKDLSKAVKIEPDNISSVGIPNDIASEIAEAYNEIESEFNIQLDEVTVGVLSDDKPFEYTPIQRGNWYYSSLVINKNFAFGTLEKFNERIMKNYVRGRLASKNVKDLFKHELAHVMTFQNSSQWHEFMENESTVTSLFKAGVSGYADNSKDGAESIAEAFIRWLNGENDKIPDGVMKDLEDYVLRWRKKK